MRGMEITRWLMQHGHSLLESAGIIGGLIFTGVGLHRDSKARRIENMISLVAQHRDLWRQASGDAKIAAIFDSQRDALRVPPTPAERDFLCSVILYLSTVYRAVKLDELLRPAGMEKDIRDFFSLPIPRDVWRDLRAYQDPDFVAFVEQIIG